MAGEASEPLLGEDEGEDVEANVEGMGAILLEHDGEGPSMGQRS